MTPATANTRILETLTKEFIDYMLVRIPRGRFLEVDEAASMIAWLVSRDNSFTTASVFDLSGGAATCTRSRAAADRRADGELLLAVEDHAAVVEHTVDEPAVGGEAGVVPVEDVVAAHLVAP